MRILLGTRDQMPIVGRAVYGVRRRLERDGKRVDHAARPSCSARVHKRTRQSGANCYEERSRGEGNADGDTAGETRRRAEVCWPAFITTAGT